MSAAADDEFLPPSSSTSATQVTLSPSVSGGIAALAIGCTLLISACALMTFNVILWYGALRGIPRDLARVGAVIGLGGVAALGVTSVIIGVVSWSSANRRKEPSALGFAATAMSLVGLIGWLIASINLMMILLS